MPTTFSNLQPVRRVAVGTSASAQGSDGISELTRTALESLLAAAWTESDAAPSFPVHDYDRALPEGDAWKACYGYNAEARTERGACGAVCYTFPVPADALTGEPCNVSGVSFRVQGDRYLDAGVDVHVVLDANAEPPSVAALAARTPDATVCATSSQTQPPNQRHGVTETVTLSPSTAATAYIHVALLLHDYTTARGAWIEGGALLADAAVSVTFSRDVTADAQAVSSLFLVTGDLRLVGSTYQDPTIENLQFVLMRADATYYYLKNSSGFDTGAASQFDARNLVPHVLDGSIAPMSTSGGTVKRGFLSFGFHGQDDETRFYEVSGGFSGIWGEDRAFTMYLNCVAYLTAKNMAGRRYRVSHVQSWSAGGSDTTVRVGFVQSDTIPAAGEVLNGVQYFQAIAWNEVILGSGPDLIGFSDAVIPSTNPPTDISVDVAIFKEPTKKYLYLVVFPMTFDFDGQYGRGVMLRHRAGQDSISLSFLPWRIDSVD